MPSDVLCPLLALKSFCKPVRRPIFCVVDVHAARAKHRHRIRKVSSHVWPRTLTPELQGLHKHGRNLFLAPTSEAAPLLTGCQEGLKPAMGSHRIIPADESTIAPPKVLDSVIIIIILQIHISLVWPPGSYHLIHSEVNLEVKLNENSGDRGQEVRARRFEPLCQEV